ncbi:MAG: heavy-metal-associated domain-containing protein [Rhodospirillaceae bacterium]|jgi:copper chaperone|nr:heavy-metal-associated domain-containing protein [Rhodospirillaceae bacterium]MBT5013405.1 heavy-metal-associated domain-containing protein [Rhodospirillaceae bacterium]MBT7356833.1 heavy-metal-associated domain-containing protein [Rhodospirillaceae bacterium]
MSKTYNVNGMTCGGCANSVSNAIKAAASGAEVSVDLDSKQVTVSGVDDDGIVEAAVSDAGFEYGGVVYSS